MDHRSSSTNTNASSCLEQRPNTTSETPIPKSGITGLFSISISYIENCSFQPRKRFDQEALQDLADSILEHGIIQPIVVRKLPSGYYQIIAGERRWRAARLAGLKEVPVVLIEADDRKAAELAMIENLQREDLNPIEEAAGYQDLIEKYDMTQEEISKLVGRSRSAVANTIRLLSLCPALHPAVAEGKLSAHHARTLLSLSPALQEKAAAIIIRNNLSVRETESLVKKLEANKDFDLDRHQRLTGSTAELQTLLSSRLGRGVKIVSGRKKGHVELEYSDLNDLNDLLDALSLLKIQNQID